MSSSSIAAKSMRQMVMHAAGEPLVLTRKAVPEPSHGEVLVEVGACGVCRTDLHVVDGDLTEPKIPLVPGHEVIGRVVALGAGADRRVTIPGA